MNIPSIKIRAGLWLLLLTGLILAGCAPKQRAVDDSFAFGNDYENLTGPDRSTMTPEERFAYDYRSAAVARMRDEGVPLSNVHLVERAKTAIGTRPSPLRPNQQKKRLSPSKPPPRLPTAATPRRGSFTYPAAVTSTARPARCVSNPRKRPAATDTNPANAVWPARADRLWKLAGVLGRSPDKGRPRFSSSPNLPARPLPAKPFMRIALFAAFSGAACLWIRHFKADPKRPPLAVPLSG